MKLTLSQQKFMDSDIAQEVRTELERMAQDLSFNTQSSYAATMLDGMPFVQKHMNYLCDRPKLDPQQYLANLRLMTRIKR